ncbi:MAG: phosphate/phosphite/phosphonate ABC transporter substrate-binding protein [Leptospirales bacterium]
MNRTTDSVAESVLRFAFGFAVVAVCLLIAGCSRRDFGTLGRRDDPVQLRLMQSARPDAVRRLGNSLEKHFETRTNVSVRAKVANDSGELARRFGNGVVHVALTNTFGYLLLRKWGDAQAVLRLRFGSGADFYEGRLVVRSDSPVRTIDDLNNRVIGFKDRYATSGYIMPLMLMRKQKVRPARSIFAGSYLAVLEGVADGRYDAGAIYYDTPGVGGEFRDARREYRAAHPGAPMKFRMLAATGQIPASPIALHPRLPDALKKTLIQELQNYASTAAGRSLLESAYDAVGLRPTDSRDYDDLLAKLRDAGLQPELLAPGGVSLLILEKMAGATIE